MHEVILRTTMDCYGTDLGFGGIDDLIMPITLVAYQEFAGSLACITIHLIEPILDVLERFLMKW